MIGSRSGAGARRLLPWLVIALSLPASGAELRGTVVEFVALQRELVRVPLPEAHVIVGPGIWLDVGEDGRDRVRDGPAAGYAVTGYDGAFSVNCSDASPANLIAWRAGYLPVLRRGIPPGGEPVEIVLTRQSQGDQALHKSLDRGDGILVLGAPPLPSADHFFDPERGILATVPEGFVLQPAGDRFTVLRLTRGPAEIRLLDPGRPFRRDKIREFIGDPRDDPDGPRLVMSKETQVRDCWALQRVFEQENTETQLLYVDGERRALVLACTGPKDRVAELRKAFEAFAEDLVLPLGESRLGGARQFRQADLGVELLVPQGWEAQPGDSTDGAMALRSQRPPSELTVTRRSSVGLAPAQLLDQLETRGGLERQRARWALVGDQPAPERVYRTTDRGSRSSVRRVATEHDGDLYLFELRSPVVGFTSASRGMDVALATAHFL